MAADAAVEAVGEVEHVEATTLPQIQLRLVLRPTAASVQRLQDVDVTAAPQVAQRATHGRLRGRAAPVEAEARRPQQPIRLGPLEQSRR